MKIPDRILFFVYGTLKKGRSNHRCLEGDGVIFKGEHVTEPIYTMANLGGFPGVLCKGSTRIYGEVYEVTNPSVIQRVFKLEGFSGVKGSQYNFYDIEEIETPWGAATMFVLRSMRYADRGIVESGKW